MSVMPGLKLAEKLLKEGDIDVVAKHHDAIGQALHHPKLPVEFHHASGAYDD